MKIRKIIIKIGVVLFSIPKTIYINLKYLPLNQAIKLPICVAYNVQIDEYRKTRISIDADKLKFGIIRLGLSKGSFYKGGKSLIHLNGGEILCKGNMSICGGFAIVINNGKLQIGRNFFSNANLLLNCSNETVIKDNVLIGWNCTIIDGNGHNMIAYQDEKKVGGGKKVLIGNHVWLAAETTILNGSDIKDDCVIAYGSVVHGNFSQEHALIAGNPAKVVKECIYWEK